MHQEAEGLALNLGEAIFLIAALLLGGALVAHVFGSGYKSLPAQKVKAERGKFTAQEVAKHCTPESLWIILKGKVYDVTPYINEHPGGTAILRNAGHDSTEGFFGPQHPDRVFDLIDDFYIGDMVL